MNSLVIAFNFMKRALREPGILIMLVLMPIFGALIAAMIFSNPPAVKLGVAAQDSQTSLIRVIEDSGRYTVAYMSEDELYAQVKNSHIKFGIILPVDYDKSLIDEDSAEKIKVISNKDDENVAAFRAVVHGYVSYLRTGNSGQLDAAIPKNIENANKPYMAMGMISMFMIMLVGAGMNLILSDKKEKTFMRLFCAPLRVYEAVLGKLLANFALGIVQITVFLLISGLVMGINWGMPVIYVFILLVFFLMTAIGLGIAIIGIVGNSEIYIMFNTILAVLTCMLGGSFFSTGLLKGVLKTISNFIPQKWEMEAFEKLAAGAAFSDIYVNLLMLLLFGAVLFTFGVKTLKPAARDL